MRVLVAPDGFTGTLTAPEAARAAADGWLSARPGDEVDLCPMSDGGPGFLDVLESSGGGRRVRVPVSGPLGEPVTASLLVLDDGATVALEVALACGTALLPPGPVAERDALAAGSAGVGHLLAAARTQGPRRVLVGLGGTASTDAGAGALAVLGAAGGTLAAPRVLPGVLLGGGGGLGGVSAHDLAGLADLRRAWAGIELVVASDVDVPLLGEHGAARGFGPQKGASADDVEVLEAALAAWVAAVENADPGTAGLADLPGAGAAGGLGHALSLLGGRRTAGADAVARAVGLDARAARADVVLTGEGCLDWQSLRGKVVARAARAAAAAGVPAVAVAGRVVLAPGQAEPAGLALVRAVARDDAELRESLARPAASLAASVAQVAAAWPDPA